MKQPRIIQLMGTGDQVQITILYDSNVIDIEDIKFFMEEAADKAADEEAVVTSRIAESSEPDLEEGDMDFDIFARIEELFKEKYGDNIICMTDDIDQVWTRRL